MFASLTSFHWTFDVVSQCVFLIWSLISCEYSDLAEFFTRCSGWRSVLWVVFEEVPLVPGSKGLGNKVGKACMDLLSPDLLFQACHCTQGNAKCCFPLQLCGRGGTWISSLRQKWWCTRVGLGIVNPCHHACSSVASVRALQPRTWTLKGRSWQTWIPGLPHGICCFSAVSQFPRLSSSQSFYLSVVGERGNIHQENFFLAGHVMPFSGSQLVPVCVCVCVCSRVLLK